MEAEQPTVHHEVLHAGYYGMDHGRAMAYLVAQQYYLYHTDKTSHGDLPPKIKGVEIGTLDGRGSRWLLTIPSVELWSVDFLPREGGEGPADQLRAKIAQIEVAFWNFHFLHMKSEQAVAQFDDGSLKFVYIDADHNYKNVKQDIELWLPKVSTPGIIGGHDYFPGRQDGVVQAVDEIFGARASKGCDWPEASDEAKLKLEHHENILWYVFL